MELCVTTQVTHRDAGPARRKAKGTETVEILRDLGGALRKN